MHQFDFFSLKVCIFALAIGGITALLDGCAAEPSLAEQDALASTRFANYSQHRVAALQEVIATPELTIDEAYCVALLKQGQGEPQCAPVLESLQACGPGRSRCRPTITIGAADGDPPAAAPGGDAAFQSYQRQQEIEEAIRRDRLMRGEPMM